MALIEAPPPPLQDFWVKACVALTKPLPIAGSEDVLVGYYRNLGVRCHPDQVRIFLRTHLDDGTVRWDYSEVAQIDVSAGLDHEIEEMIVPLEGKGIWYQGGRVFFGSWGDAG
jgi:hypothetical protein